MNSFDIALIVLGTVGLAAETLFRRQRGRRIDWTEARTSVVLGAVRFLLGLVAQLAVVGALYKMLAHHAVVHLSGAPWVFIAYFVVGDFWNYLMHRASHRLPILWAAHVVHHSTEDFNLTAAARLSPFEAVWHPLLGFWAPLVGVPMSVATGVTTFNLVFALLCHTDAIGRLGPLDRWIVTPSAHRVHHGRNSQYIDTNFGTVLLVWDRLFGTLQTEVAVVEFGVLGDFEDSSIWRVAVGNYPALVRSMSRRIHLNDPMGALGVSRRVCRSVTQ